MAKAKKATAETENDQTEATETEKVNGNGERNPRGTSLFSKIKTWMLQAHGELTVNGKLEADTAAEFEELVSLIPVGRSLAGFPPEVKLEAVNTKLATHLASMPVVDGRAAPSQEWNDEYRMLLNKKARIEAEITKAQS
jgi:hypothetical protein